MVYVIEVLAKAAWQNMLMIFLILWVTPSQGQENGQRRTQTEKIFNAEKETGLGGCSMKISVATCKCKSQILSKNVNDDNREKIGLKITINRWFEKKN